MGSTHINLNQSRLTWVAVAMLWAFSASGYAGTTQVDDTHFRVGPDAQVKTVTIAALGSATSQTHDGGSQAISPTMDTPLLPYRTVRIGHVAPLTGGVAHLGKDNENGVRLAIDEANTAGTVIDRHLIRFELISADDKSDPKIGNVVAANLVAAGAVGVIGHLNSGTTIPASVIYNKAGIPVITGSATHPTLTEQGFKGVFRVVGRDDQQGPTVANYLIRHIQPKIVAVIDDATAYGEGLANEVEKTLRAAGVKVLPREKGTDKTVDWKAVLDNVKDRNPDAVFYGGMDTSAGPLMKQARELKMTAVFAFGDGACTDRMAELAGAAAEGLICAQAGIPVQAADKKFLAAYKAKFTLEPILYSPYTYDATKILIAAMKSADSIDPLKFMSALAATNYSGATGSVRFDTKGDRVNAEMTIFTLRNGQITPVAVVRDHSISPIH